MDYISSSNRIQTDQNKKEYRYQRRRIGAIETIEYKNARRDFVVFTEKNEKQYVRLATARDPRGIFHCIDGFTDNPAI